ncbi:MAG: hypothetical protein HY301_02945 [Verrucomicrobia bacterium]|nr:hypothetical protein [Verrucomicrobiota bacterium]
MIVVLADDLSGAAELAGAALNRGLTAEVQTVFTPKTAADVICVDTDSRSLAPSEAARVVGENARAIAAVKPDWIYKKCDSVLRGNVLAEIRAIMAATQKARAVLISANPTRGRVIRGGAYFVEGRPLHETAFANDPEHPRRTSLVAALLGDDLSDVETPDASCTEDLAQPAHALDADSLPAGGVEFFDAILAARTPTRTLATPPPVDASFASGATLLVCGSAVAWPKRTEVAARFQIPAFPLPHDGTAIAQALRTAPAVAIGIGDGPATHGLTSAALVKHLAASVKRVLAQAATRRVLLEGGATAAAVFRELGWTRLTACQPCAPGVGVLAPIGTTGLELCIKPGSYDWPEGFWPPKIP